MACFALFPRTQLYCTGCGENVGTLRITNLIYSRKSGGCEGISIFHGSAPQGYFLRRRFASPSGRSTQSAWKQCGARHARLNRVTRTVARRFAHSTSEWPKTLPRGSNGGRSPLGLSFSTIFLQTKKDGAVGDRRLPNAAGKIVQRKMESPKGVGFAER